MKMHQFINNALWICFDKKLQKNLEYIFQDVSGLLTLTGCRIRYLFNYYRLQKINKLRQQKNVYCLKSVKINQFIGKPFFGSTSLKSSK